MFTSSRKQRTFIIAVSTAVAVSAAPSVAEANAASAERPGFQFSSPSALESSSSIPDVSDGLRAAREFARDQASAIASGNPAVEGLLHEAIDNIVEFIHPGLIGEPAEENPTPIPSEPERPLTPEERGGKPIFEISW